MNQKTLFSVYSGLLNIVFGSCRLPHGYYQHTKSNLVGLVGCRRNQEFDKGNSKIVSRYMA